MCDSMLKELEDLDQIIGKKEDKQPSYHVQPEKVITNNSMKVLDQDTRVLPKNPPPAKESGKG